MALSATGVFECRVSGSDANAGYFNPAGGSPGTDWSQQDAAQVAINGTTVTAVVHTTTTQLTLAGVTVSAAWNRNGLRITGGTALSGLYEITAVDVPNNRVTLDRTAGTAAATATGAVGGALASPGAAAGLAVVGAQTIHVLGGTYTIGSGTVNTAGNRVNTTVALSWFGHGATRADNVTRPVLNAGAASITLFTQGGIGARVEGLEFTNSGALASVVGPVFSGNSMLVRRIKVTGMTGTGMEFTGGTIRASECEAVACAGNGGIYFTSSAHLVGCVSRGHAAARGIYDNATGLSVLSRCVVSGCGHTGIAASSSVTLVVEDCVAHGSTGANGHGFSVGRGTLRNCVAAGNAQQGFDQAGAAGNNGVLRSCASYNNAGGHHDTTWDVNEGFLTLTADPFQDAAGLDFSLNEEEGGGALLRGAGWPSSYPGLAPTSHPDVGAYQSEGGGSGAAAVHPVLSSNIIRGVA